MREQRRGDRLIRGAALGDELKARSKGAKNHFCLVERARRLDPYATLDAGVNAHPRSMRSAIFQSQHDEPWRRVREVS